ncbi:MAG: hypothetical protein VKP62_15285 [Candidatus Sericytochromatia bacterium]|nr:hypothetical protein [Candidatus Sericytochromatia bacterium]
MTTPSPTLPPLPTWKDLYDRTESFWTAPLQALLGSDSYLAAAGVLREQSLTQHQLTREALEAYWAALRLPSMADHARLAGQVVQLERKVEALHDQLDGLTEHLVALRAALAAHPAEEVERASRKKASADA